MAGLKTSKPKGKEKKTFLDNNDFSIRTSFGKRSNTSSEAGFVNVNKKDSSFHNSFSRV